MISRVASSLSEFCIRHRRPVVVLILVATAAMGLTLTRIDVRTEFSDMVPRCRWRPASSSLSRLHPWASRVCL